MTNSRLRGCIRLECYCLLTGYGGVALAWLKPRPCLQLQLAYKRVATEYGDQPIWPPLSTK